MRLMWRLGALVHHQHVYLLDLIPALAPGGLLVDRVAHVCRSVRGCLQALALCDQYHADVDTLDLVAATRVHGEHELLMCYLCALATCAFVARERLALGNEIALSDRLFSIFEPHTELIYRGKARATVEFGHRVLISEDAASFIIDASVMANGEQDRDAAIPLVRPLPRRPPPPAPPGPGNTATTPASKPPSARSRTAAATTDFSRPPSSPTTSSTSNATAGPWTIPRPCRRTAAEKPRSRGHDHRTS